MMRRRMARVVVVVAVCVAGFPAISAAQQMPSSPLAAASEELKAALDESVLPRSVPELLVELAKRANGIQETIAGGAFGQVWVPAMATKTVALVLESHISALEERERAKAAMAIKEIVTCAWDLDTNGDLGNKEKLDAAYARLARAVSDLKAVYAPR